MYFKQNHSFKQSILKKMQNFKPDLTLASVTCVPAHSKLLPVKSREFMSRKPCKKSRQTHSTVAIARRVLKYCHMCGALSLRAIALYSQH